MHFQGEYEISNDTVILKDFDIHSVFRSYNKKKLDQIVFEYRATTSIESTHALQNDEYNLTFYAQGAEPETGDPVRIDSIDASMMKTVAYFQGAGHGYSSPDSSSKQIGIVEKERLNVIAKHEAGNANWYYCSFMVEVDSELFLADIQYCWIPEENLQLSNPLTPSE